jgi:hypothetical protein
MPETPIRPPAIDAAALDRLLWQCCELAAQVGTTQPGRTALEDLAQLLGQLVGSLLGDRVEGPEGATVTEPVRVCFAVMLFTPGPGGWSTWVSNAERPDMVKALREMATNLAAGRDLN